MNWTIAKTNIAVPFMIRKMVPGFVEIGEEGSTMQTEELNV